MQSRVSSPLARDKGLVIEELGDELLVYDLEIKHAHCLTPLAARVWRECNGKTRPDAIATTLGVTVSEVDQAIAELDRCDLLASYKLSSPKSGMTRRDLGLRVTKVAAAAATVPLILSIAAPAVAATASQEQFCFDLAPGGTNNCDICNNAGQEEGGGQGGANTLCCCCHQPTKPDVGSLKLCAADAQQCCCQTGPLDYGPSHHCTEPGGNIQNCTGVVC